MRGGFQKREKGIVANTKELEQLKKDIAELNLRKSNIKLEIDKAIREATAKLESEYVNKLQDLEVTYQSKINQVEGKKAEAVDLWLTLREKNAGLVDKENGLNKLSEEQEKIRIHNEAVKNQNDKDAVDNLKTLAELNSARENQGLIIANMLKELEEKRNILDQREFELVEHKRLSDEKDKIQNDRQKELDNLSLNNIQERQNLKAQLADVARAKEDVAALKAHAEQKIQQANDLYKQVEEYQATLNKDKEEVNSFKETIPNLRESLEDRESTVREKEKYLMLKERDIDAKIVILKKLREA